VPAQDQRRSTNSPSRLRVCVCESETGQCQISETATSGQRDKFGQKAVCVL